MRIQQYYFRQRWRVRILGQNSHCSSGLVGGEWEGFVVVLLIISGGDAWAQRTYVFTGPLYVPDMARQMSLLARKIFSKTGTIGEFKLSFLNIENTVWARRKPVHFLLVLQRMEFHILETGKLPSWWHLVLFHPNRLSPWQYNLSRRVICNL